jgi:hypothetical protein
MEWYRNDKAAVAEALRGGERPDLATTMASGPLDELVALHQDLGIFAILDEVEVQRARAGVADELRLAHAGDLALCGASVLKWGQRGTVSRTGCVTATGLGTGADPARQQWTASPSARKASRVAALSSRYPARCARPVLGLPYVESTVIFRMDKLSSQQMPRAFGAVICAALATMDSVLATWYIRSGEAAVT